MMSVLWAWLCRAARGYWRDSSEPLIEEELLQQQTAP